MSSSMFAPQSGKTPLSALGEFGLIEHLTKDFSPVQRSTIKGIGDDCAVIDSGVDALLVTTDMLAEGIHFDLTYTPLKHLGYKACVVNFSDIYAMNGRPEQIAVGLAVSNRFPVEALETLYEGMALACKAYGVDLVGGDTISSKAGLVLSITAIGRAPKDKVVYRSGAQKNDILLTSGDLGGAYMGLQLLEREKQVFLEHPGANPDLDGYDYVLERQLKPEARRDIVELFEELGIVPSAMIDISDGLASELLHIAKHSQCGIQLFENKIPIDPQTYQLARDFALDPTVCALSGGEDYELLFAIKPQDFEKLKNNPLVSPIGYIDDATAGQYMTDKSGNRHALKAQGWKSF